MTSRPAAGGGRWIEVAPERLDRWFDGYQQRHGELNFVADSAAQQIVVAAADGSRAEVEIPFPPFDQSVGSVREALMEHIRRPRRVGVLLVRLGGFAAGIIDGADVQDGRTGRRQVHGRAAAGGWSQQRFARRREGQARVALHAAADLATNVLVPESTKLDAIVTGGDRGALAAVLADPRLAGLRPLIAATVLDVPDPRRAVLDSMPARVRAVRIRVRDVPDEADHVG